MSNKELTEELAAAVDRALAAADPERTPAVCERMAMRGGYDMIFDMVCQMAAREGLPPTACIAQIESGGLL